MERLVYDALTAAGDDAGAFLWRRLCRDLTGPLRLAVVARSRKAGRRWLDRRSFDDRIQPVLLTVDDATQGLALGTQDSLLSSHAVLVLTSMTAPLGQGERTTLEVLDEAGAPTTRAVTLADAHLLERLADDPEAERQAVHARVRALLPTDWSLLEDGSLLRGIDDWAESIDTLRAARIREVARFLVGQREEALATTATHAQGRVDALHTRLEADDAALADDRRKARRLAAHTLAIVRRQTECLELDLAAFLRELEADLPAQIHGLGDADLARRTLPHWLSHVVETWMADRLGHWRRDVLAELEELELDDAIGVELLAPALQPATVRGETRWSDRLGTTAAFGGAAALMMLGLWMPGLLALAGGFALSGVFRGPDDAENLGKLVTTARMAVRQMGDDASRLLADQLEQLTEELASLGEEGEDVARREARAALQESLRRALATADHAHTQRQHLTEVLAHLPETE